MAVSFAQRTNLYEAIVPPDVASWILLAILKPGD
jgi:hypothetical protein